MDTTAQPSEAESHPDMPTTSQDARSHRDGPPDSAWGKERVLRLGAVASTPKYNRIWSLAGRWFRTGRLKGKTLWIPGRWPPPLPFVGWEDLTFTDPLAGTWVTPCPLADLIGNTSIMTGSSSEGLLTPVPKRMRWVSTHISPNRNTLSSQRTKTKNAQVINTGRRRSTRPNISPLLKSAW